MLPFQLGFKSKLRIVITLALIGFVVLSAISFNALKTLEGASDRVDSISQQAHFLKDLQLDVLQLNEKTNLNVLKQLVPKYDDQLNELEQQLSPEQAALIADIRLSLRNWVDGRVKALAESKRIGQNNNQGLRAELGKTVAEVEKTLFSMFRKPFNKAKQDMTLFMEQRTDAQFQAVIKTLDAFSKKAKELNFEDFYGPKIKAVKANFEQLGKAVFTMKTETENSNRAYAKLASAVATSNEFLSNELMRAKDDSVEASEQAQLMILGVSITVALLVVGLLIRTSTDVVSTLGKMSATLYKLAEGDLTQRLEVNEARNDELDKVGLAVNEMTTSLSQILMQVTQSSQRLDQGASDLSHSLDSMVKVNAETNLQAESVASAAEEISVTILDMASATETAHEQSRQAQDSADQGGEVITSAIDSLGKLALVFDDLNVQVSELENASSKVDGVTEMINGLAEQTNLLALNAAIEAARAGDAGRGFSVVADEVRGLAEKTVQATQDINDIIGAMHGSIQALLKAMTEGSAHVDSGRQLGDKAAGAVDQIKTLVQDVTNRNQELKVNIDDVAKATQMIAENMDQVAGNVSQVNEQSKEVQEYVADSSEKATNLLSMTQRFRCQ